MGLKEVRGSLALTQKQVASMSNVTQQSISRLENGVNIKYSTLIKIANALNVSIEDIIKKG